MAQGPNRPYSADLSRGCPLPTPSPCICHVDHPLYRSDLGSGTPYMGWASFSGTDLGLEQSRLATPHRASLGGFAVAGMPSKLLFWSVLPNTYIGIVRQSALLHPYTAENHPLISYDSIGPFDVNLIHCIVPVQRF
jgi:hypothetical protein